MKELLRFAINWGAVNSMKESISRLFWSNAKVTGFVIGFILGTIICIVYALKTY